MERVETSGNNGGSRETTECSTWHQGSMALATAWLAPNRQPTTIPNFEQLTIMESSHTMQARTCRVKKQNKLIRRSPPSSRNSGKQKNERKKWLCAIDLHPVKTRNTTREEKEKEKRGHAPETRGSPTAPAPRTPCPAPPRRQASWKLPAAASPAASRPPRHPPRRRRRRRHRRLALCLDRCLWPSWPSSWPCRSRRTCHWRLGMPRAAQGGEGGVR